jgi:predicted RNase H-like HicB family nuclease
VNFIGNICFEELEKGWYTHIPGLGGLWGSGSTIDEARDDLLNAMPGWAQLSRGDFSGFVLET